MDIIDLIEEGKVKRYFRTRNKLCFDGAISHITQHASGAEPLFLEDSDYLYMLHLMKEVLCEFKCNVLSFALMPNHIHLLLKFIESNMPYAMKELLQRYAEYFNKKYHRKGHVFSGSYRSALCFDDSYLLAASLYIHMNPVKKRLVQNPADYRWSSCALFLSEVKKDTFIDYRFILDILNEDISVASVEYSNLLEKLRINLMKDVIEEPKALDMIVNMLKKSNGKWLIEHGLLGDSDLENKIEELKNKGRLKGPEERAARKFLIEQLKSRGFSVAKISEKLNLTSPVVYAYLRKQ